MWHEFKCPTDIWQLIRLTLICIMSPVGLILFCFLATSIAQDKPNIIFILADDLGFNDIGYNNPEVITPNINDLAANGVILDRNYVQPVCTPSRTALLSGTYPYKIGMQVSILTSLIYLVSNLSSFKGISNWEQSA